MKIRSGGLRRFEMFRYCVSLQPEEFGFIKSFLLSVCWPLEVTSLPACLDTVVYNNKIKVFLKTNFL